LTTFPLIVFFTFPHCVNHFSRFGFPAPGARPTFTLYLLLSINAIPFKTNHNSMCAYQTLFYDDDCGYVILCKGCDSIQVAFGNVMLTWSQPDFYDFYNHVIQLQQETPADFPPNKKSIAIPVPCEGVRILLTARELNQLHHMLDTAETELQSQQLMNLFDRS
jgi:hypothetical protein